MNCTQPMFSRIFFVLLFASMTQYISSQSAPNSFKYQAVARDAGDKVIPDQEIGVRFSIIDLNTQETVYLEIHQTITTSLGHFYLEIGSGMSMEGEFGDIDWMESAYSLEVAIDVEGGENFTVLGNSPILAVPIANSAHSADHANSAQFAEEAAVANLATHATTAESASFANIADSVVHSPVEPSPWKRVDAGAIQFVPHDSFYVHIDPISRSLQIGANIDDISFARNENSAMNSLHKNSRIVPNMYFGPDFDSNDPFDWLMGGENLNIYGKTVRVQKIFATDICPMSITVTDSGGDNVSEIDEGGIKTSKVDSEEGFFDSFDAHAATVNSLQLEELNASEALIRRAILEGEVFVDYNIEGNEELEDEIKQEAEALRGRIYAGYIPTTGFGGSNFHIRRATARLFMSGRIGVEQLVGNEFILSGVDDLAAELEIYHNTNKVGGFFGNGDGIHIIGTHPNPPNAKSSASQTNPDWGIEGIGNGNRIFYLNSGKESFDPEAAVFVNNGIGVMVAHEFNTRTVSNKSGHEIWMSTLQGMESGTYERGVATLVDGEVFVPYSGHFNEVVNPNTVTVMTTPHSAKSKGLAVVEKLPDGFKIKELSGGKGNYSFDWEVKGKRKGQENYKAVRNIGATIPKMVTN